MTYELAKKLKDAGYPQKEHDDQELMDGITIEVPGDAVYAPSLSELIEACGYGFGGLIRLHTGNFQAMGGALEKAKHEGQGFYSIQVFGSTPEEAVAELWLALNSK